MADMRVIVTSFEESRSPVLMIESFDIAMPGPAKYLPVVSFAGAQVVPFHLRICPCVAPMRLILPPVTDVSPSFAFVTAPLASFTVVTTPSLI